MKKGIIWNVKDQGKEIEVTIKDGNITLSCIIPVDKKLPSIRKRKDCEYEAIDSQIIKLVVDGVMVFENREHLGNSEAEQAELDQLKGNDPIKKGVIKEFRMSNGEAIIDIKINSEVKKYRASMNQSQFSRLQEGQVCEFKVKMIWKNRRNEETNIIIRLIINGEDILLPATAPYNFVPVNSKVVKAKNQESGIVISESSDGQLKYPEIPSFDRYHEELHTGYIDVNIETLSPLYIRDTYNECQEKMAKVAGLKCKECKEKKCDECKCAQYIVNPDFFSPGGTPKIPGSSLRGMVRNLVEIVSYSQTEFYENKRFYYRKVANQGRYQNLMIEGSNNSKDGLRPAIKAGWLKKEKGKYYIYPLEKQQIYRINATLSGSSWKVLMENNEGEVHTKELAKFDFYPISFIPIGEQIHLHRRGTIYLRYALIGKKNYELGHDRANLDSQYKKGYLVLSGNMGRKHMHPVIHCPENPESDMDRVEINHDIIESYKGDISREPKADLIKMLEKYPGGVPCFYLEVEKKIKSIGHTPFFRLAYDKKVMDHIPPENRDFKGIDLARAIFGDTDKFAGRVFFEDAKIMKNTGQYNVLSPKILSTPKPTTVQHYLEPAEGKDLADWNDDTNIRGHKLYWHRKPSDDDDYRSACSWQETGQPIYDSQHTVISALKPGATFSGRIRFENLSDIELGALLFVLDLPESYAHKIGMGKPLGLGSIKIQPTLVLSNRKERYQKLFDNNRWYLPEGQRKEMQCFKNKFAGHMLCQLGKTDIGDPDKTYWYWQYNRIKDLGTMLDTSHAKLRTWMIDTEYMRIIPEQKINDFKERRVLPVPQQVVDSARKWSEGKKNDGRH